MDGLKAATLSTEPTPGPANRPTPTLVELLRNPVQLLAFGFGSGLSPRAPGTIGTVVAIPLYLLLAQLSLPAYSLVVLAAGLVGIYLCGRSSDELGVDDHSGIVWDEFVGFWLTMWAMPPSIFWIVMGFIVFRIFDIWKPWPISWMDREIKGGIGVMLDDVAAGIAACAVLHFGLNLASL